MRAPVRFEPVTIETAPGVVLAAEVCKPVETPVGVVTFVHGFGGNKHENGLFRAIAEECVARRFTCVLYDWRGIGGSFGKFESTPLELHVEDFKRVVEWARGRFQESSGSVCALGFSLGAAVVGLALRANVSLSSAAYLSPAVRPRLAMWPRYKRDIWKRVKSQGVVEKPGSSLLLGREVLQSLRQTDLGPRAFEVGIPLLVCQGTEDARIACAQIRQLYRPRSDDFRYIELNGASHSFRPPDNHWPRIANMVSAWFAEQTTGRLKLQ